MAQHTLPPPNYPPGKPHPPQRSWSLRVAKGTVECRSPQRLGGAQVRRDFAAAAIMAIILASAVVVTAAAVSAGVSLWTGFPSTADLDPSRAALLGATWIVM